MVITTGLLFLLGQLGRLGLWNQTVVIYAYELCLAAGVTSLLVIPRYRRMLRTVSRVLIAVLSVSFLTSMLWFRPIENMVALLYLLRLSGYLIAIDLVPPYLASRYHQTPRLPIFILSISLIVPAIVQYFFLPDLRALFYQGWDPHAFRVFGQFFEPAIAAAVYGCTVISYLPFVQSKKYSAVFIIFAAVLTMLAALTFSRGFMIAAAATALWFSVRYRSTRIVAGAVVLLIALMVSLSPKPFGEGVNLFRSSTITSRLTDYQEALRIAESSPVLGVGYNHIRSVKTQSGAQASIPSHSGASFHSSFLIILATGGIIGLSVFMWYLIATARLSGVMECALVFLSVYSLFDNILLHPFVLMMLVYVRAVEVTSRRRP